MQIFKELEDVFLKNTVVTTGNFDGVHLGHRFLIERLVSLAKARECQSVLVMFYPHPREVLGNTSFRYLSSPERNIGIFEEYGVDVVVQVAFTKELATWSAEDFVKKVLVDRLGMSYFLVGYDHHLGNPQKKTDFKTLSQKYKFELEQALPYEKNEVLVSSSVIRKALSEGDVKQAKQLLGREYAMRYRVVEGQKIGRSIGFPTANLQPIFEKHLIPAEGVYAVQVLYDREYYGGMLHIGQRPTLNDGRGLTIEVNIFDFNRDIYNKIVDVCFVAFLRENRRFETIEELQQCLQVDAENTKTCLT